MVLFVGVEAWNRELLTCRGVGCFGVEVQHTIILTIG